MEGRIRKTVKLVVIVQELDKLLKKNVRHVTVQVKFVNVKKSMLKFQRVSIMVNKFVCLEKGEAGVNGGPAGDLYVVVHVRNHEFFGEREGRSHYFCEMPLTFAQMALGDEVEVPTVHGEK